ncbi:MAG: hypothetical protein DRP87_12820 [Spirochaetes bacterium]|nr:MAG: hypothetical protein DRP87_12820 [Spirochaetota bacterium]
MLTKLTLTIDKRVVEQAKLYAKKKHRSVSKIVEEYLMNVSYNENKFNMEYNLESPLTNSITGMFEKEYNGEDYDK